MAGTGVLDSIEVLLQTVEIIIGVLDSKEVLLLYADAYLYTNLVVIVYI